MPASTLDQETRRTASDASLRNDGTSSLPASAAPSPPPQAYLSLLNAAGLTTYDEVLRAAPPSSKSDDRASTPCESGRSTPWDAPPRGASPSRLEWSHFASSFGRLTPTDLPSRSSSRLLAAPPQYTSTVPSPLQQQPFSEGANQAKREPFSLSRVWSTKLRGATVKVIYYSFALAFIYLVLVGMPLWDGVLRLMWHLWRENTLAFGFLLFSGINFGMTFVPIVFGRYEKPAPAFDASQEVSQATAESRRKTALLIPCYKAAAALPNTIRNALLLFAPENIFVVDNGNTERGTDGTEQVCAAFNVNYLWVPVGSKIGAEYVAASQPAMERFSYVMLIDDDVELPSNLPLVTERFEQNAKLGVVGYTIRSVGANRSKGTVVQQLQDLEYRQAGLRHCFGARWGSATFFHGAIALWRKETLLELFKAHPGFKISEDYFFGLKCQESGHYVDFCSQVFVCTETPPYLFGPSADHPFRTLARFVQRCFQRKPTRRSAAVLPLTSSLSEDQLKESYATLRQPGSSSAASSSSDVNKNLRDQSSKTVEAWSNIDLEKAAVRDDENNEAAAAAAAAPPTRGGYGEMTVFRQRYERWSFMHVYSLGPQLKCLFFSWNLGWRVPVAKLLQIQEIYAVLLSLIMPFALPCSLYWNPTLTAIVIAVNMAIGVVGSLVFNFFHLRKRPEGAIAWSIAFIALPYRFANNLIRVAAIYKSLIEYGFFFATKTHKLHQHPSLAPLVQRAGNSSSDGIASQASLPRHT